MIELASDEAIGRAAELRVLADCLERAHGGAGRTVVLSGEPGIGKSTLLSALVRAAAGAGCEVIQGRAWELADAPAYFPAWSCLRRLGLGSGAPTPEGGAAETQTFHLWESVLAKLAELSATRTIVWALEDLHAADAQTLDLLTFLSQPVRALRVLVVVSLRPSDPRSSSAARPRLARLTRDSLELAVPPLGAEAVGLLAQRWRGSVLDPKLQRELLERTGGNPLFVVECARALRSGSSALSSTLVQLVTERVELLPRDTSELLSAAAILGDDFVVSMLGKVSGKLPALVIDGLQPAVLSGLLHEVEPGRFRFSHAVVREAIDQSTPGHRRVELHALAEKAAAALGSGPAQLLSRAQHALAALSPATEAHVVEVVEAAVALLERQGAFDRAHGLCRRLLDAHASGALPPAGPGQLTRAAGLALRAGLFAESRRLALEALSLARVNSDARSFAEAALCLGGELQPGVRDPVLIQHLEESLSGLAPGQTALRLRLTARLAAATQPAADPGVPITLARGALTEARALGDADVLIDTLWTASSAISDFADVAETRELAQELLALAMDRGDDARALRASARLAMAEGELGNLGALNGHIDQMLERARRVGHPRLTWRPLLMASMWAIPRGRLGDSERWIAEVTRLAQLTDDPALMFSLVVHGMLRDLALCNEAQLESALQRIRADQFPGSEFMEPRMSALVAARLGDFAAAALAVSRLPPQAMARAQHSSSLGVLGEVLAAGGSKAQRLEILGLLRPRAGREIFMGHVAISYEGPVRRVLGLLEASLGDTAAAEAQLRAALGHVREQGLMLWVCRLCFELAELLEPRGRTQESAALLAEAAALAQDLGAPGLIRRSSRATSATPPGPLVARPAPASLTLRREGDVWAISFGGGQVRVQDRRGMELLARLIERPGEEIHAVALAGDTDSSLSEPHTVEALDDQAARAYRRRLNELEAQVLEAEGRGDAVGSERLERERGLLTQELSRAFGLGGAPRPMASVSERARVNVQRRLKDAIQRLGEADPALGEYLRKAVRTGTFCTFRP